MGSVSLAFESGNFVTHLSPITCVGGSAGFAYWHQCGSILFTEIVITGALSQQVRSLIEACHAVRKPSHTGRLQEGAWVGSSSLQVLLSKSQICEWTSSQMTVAPSYWVNPRHGGGEVQASHPPLFPFWIPAPKHTNKHIALHFCVWGNVYYVAMVTWTIWKNGYYFLGVKTSV